ncbi:MAG: cytochrome-c peroxidase [Burkholderiaceae bacterium]|jgi:cytochrome c peroxidase|nr:cytochrome-c peroxidase [Burkholderiaceae bacterium]
MSFKAIHAFAVLPLALTFVLGTQARAAAQEPIQPLEAPKITNPAKVELGKQLFFDPRLSRSGFISCNSCHNLSMGGSDGLKVSIGDRWQKGAIRAPTVLNSSLNLAQFWNGRAKDLESQATGPLLNPIEMNTTSEAAELMVNSLPGYREEFKKVYGTDKASLQQIGDAIAAFETTLITPNSRFDKWLKGDKTAITDYELAGYELFKSVGCVACHNGPGVGGNSFQKFGLVNAYKSPNPSQGRADVTHDDSDRMMFKVPLLRNVALIPPYFHDGSANTLTQAVETMGWLQLGKKFTADQNAQIVAFLKTLTGDQPTFPLPQLPPSNDETPRPDPFAPVAQK